MTANINLIYFTEILREVLRFTENDVTFLNVLSYRSKKMRKYQDYDNITSKIIGCAIEVHRNLGPGLLESTYQKCLIYELKELKLAVQSEIKLPIKYKGLQLKEGYRIDILVENSIVLELKTVECLSKVHYAQVLTYMNLGNYPIGYLLNFDVKLLKEGIKRFVL